jgi:mannan polymerase II complex MNN10 subunit
MTQPIDKRFHYNEFDRDFMVNMAGCEWGRDCWAEMYAYRELSIRINRSIFKKIKDAVSGFFERLFGIAKKGEANDQQSDSGK